MLEGRIQSTIELPDRFKDLSQRKSQAEALADRLRDINPVIADRIEHCSDTVQFLVFKNGYKTLDVKRLRLCRVRGCPICEYQNQRRTRARIHQCFSLANKSRSTHKWMLLELPVESVSPEDLHPTLSMLTDSVSRLTKLKAFKAKDYIRLTSISFLCDRVLCSSLLLIFAPSSMHNGKNYIRKSDWQGLWEQSFRLAAPNVAVTQLGRDWKKSITNVWNAGIIDLSFVPDEHLHSFIQGIHRKKLLTFAGMFQNAAPQTFKKPSKKYHPSEVANILATQREYFGALPNPDKQDIPIEYLQLLDPWEDDEIA